MEVKLLPQDNELYVLALSRDRQSKERSMRRRQLKALWKRLRQLQHMKLTAPELLLKLGESQGPLPGRVAFGRSARARPGPTRAGFL